MEKTIEKFRKLLELTGKESAEKLLNALETILPDDKIKTGETVVTLKIGWAVGNDEEPGNNCSIFIKVDNLKE